MSDKKKLIYADDLLNAIRDDHNINGANFARIRRHIEAAPAVEAVPVVHWKWIPVTERLPEDCGSYIVVVKYKYDHENEYDYGVDVATYYTYDNPDAYIDNHWDTYNDWYEGQQYIHITHWMPMPNPPKGELPWDIG